MGVDHSGREKKHMEFREWHSKANSSSNSFIIYGFPSFQPFHRLLFGVFLSIYLLTITGNGIVFLLTSLDQKLRTPMYFFVSHLSFLDLSYISVTVPKMLAKFVVNSSIISLSGCLLQMYFFLSLGATECFLLTAMSFDRYCAICQPLHYATHMTRRLCTQLAVAAWTGGFLTPLVHTILASRLPFCGPNVIHHYYCDHPPLLKLACADTSLNVAIGSSIAFFVIMSTFSLVLFSYIKIIGSILKISSQGGKRKAFSTCTSHLIVVNLFYLPIIFMYIRPTASYVSEVDSLVAMLYSFLTPTLNPLIYTLRNKDIKEAVKRKMTLLLLPYGVNLGTLNTNQCNKYLTVFGSTMPSKVTVTQRSRYTGAGLRSVPQGDGKLES
ncbi:olfactory receptor 6N1-like [Ambystoma mexicanum]|uniref:olfactory receptor 6N1-like n=1 Tax=Ambystoma mexicanum TaxID=8296 RepID=UPI0037E9A6E1